MQIILSKYAGFCYGADLAYKITERLVKEGKYPIYMLGEIVHNKDVIYKLEKGGVKKIDSLKQATDKNGILLIRAHGTTLEILDKARKRGLKIADATCPNVKKVHQLAKFLLKNKYKIILLGDKGHEEVNGIASCVGNKIVVIENEKEANKLPKFSKIGFVSQTTQSPEKFVKIAEILKKKAKEIKVFNTICNDATNRQKEVKELARRVNLMIVIGGRNSANTKRLWQISRKIVKTYHIEKEYEIKKLWFKKVKKIGIVTGASTPYWLVNSIIAKIKDLK